MTEDACQYLCTRLASGSLDHMEANVKYHDNCDWDQDPVTRWLCK